MKRDQHIVGLSRVGGSLMPPAGCESDGKRKQEQATAVSAARELEVRQWRMSPGGDYDCERAKIGELPIRPHKGVAKHAVNRVLDRGIADPDDRA